MIETRGLPVDSQQLVEVPFIEQLDDLSRQNKVAVPCLQVLEKSLAHSVPSGPYPIDITGTRRDRKG